MRRLILCLMITLVFPVFLFARSFEAIDRHALNTPKSAEVSIESLARYLTTPAQNDSDKIRAIFRWVTANISYDTKAYFVGSPHSGESGNILKDRTAVCDGFSSLMESLGEAAGLRIVKISGHAKGYGYQIGDKMTGAPDHAWNAVWLHGRWQLLDATWGAGYMDEKGRFIRQFEPYYFLPSPLDLIDTHFPEEARWQLLEPAITKAQFEALPFIKPAWYHHGFKMVNYNQGTIVWNDSTILAIDSPDHAFLIARLIQNNQELDRSFTFVQQIQDQIHIYLDPPQSGKYVLRLYSKAPDNQDSDQYQWALDYLVQYQSKGKQNTGFPEVYKTFFDHKGYLSQPFRKALKRGTSSTFDLIIPNAISVQVIQGEHWTPLLQSGNRFYQQIEITGKEVLIGALFKEKGSYNILLKYEVK